LWEKGKIDHFISSILGPNILLNTLFTTILSTRSSVNLGDRVSHPRELPAKQYFCNIKFLFFNSRLCTEWYKAFPYFTLLLIFFVNKILICQRCFQMCELFHHFKGDAFVLYIVPCSCDLFSTFDHALSFISINFWSNLMIWYDIWYDMIYIFYSSWVDTRWQQYITHLHINSTLTHKQHAYYRDRKIGKCGPCPVLRMIPWHLPYNWGKSTEKPQLG
jgi:hypothetical protein